MQLVADARDKVGAGHLRADCPLLRVELQSADPYVLVWRVPGPSRPDNDRIIGFAADPAFVTGLFERILTASPLLPPSLGGDNRRLLSIRVLTDKGESLFASSADWSQYASEQVLERELGSLRLGVALRPSAAGTLIIGGLPRNRLPLLVALLALTTGLVVVAIVQLRREHELARLRAGFVSGVSHELRTPLAQIRMFGETLHLGRVRSPAERERSLGIIVQESQRLTRLIENVLQFSRAERGASTVSLTSVRVDLLVHEIVDSFEPLARPRRVSFARRIEEGVVVPADAGALRQIILNLLDNAVKYGPVGETITVGASWHEGMARVSVEDQGPGIAGAHTERIWEPFYRIPANGEASGGTGIGLAIVRELVTLHHGRVWLESAEPAGARFIVELPGASRTEGKNEWPKAVAAGT